MNATTYSLGIDLGTFTCTVARRRAESLATRPVDAGATVLPVVALRGASGQVLDPAPLAAALLQTAADRVAPRPGARPDVVVVTHPLDLGTGAEDVMAAAAADAFGPAAVLVPAPIAAMARAAATHGLGDDALVAIVDLGGSTTDVTLVRRGPSSFDLVGEPASLTDLGGTDLDGAVLSLVDATIGDVSSTVDADDRSAMFALRRLLASCRHARERLSIENVAFVDVALPHAQGQVEITRTSYERTIAPALVEVADLVATTTEDAGLTPFDLAAIVLVGGAARTPLVSEVLSERLRRPVRCDAEPEATVALGAAMFADVVGVDDPGSTPSGFGGIAGLESLADIPPVGPITAGGPLPWEPRGATPTGDPAARRDDAEEQDRLGDTWGRASAPPGPVDPPPAPGGGWADDDVEDLTSVLAPTTGGWGQTSEDQVQRLTTSDTDPFGRSNGLVPSVRRPSSGDGHDDDDHRAGALDRRLMVGGGVAACLVVVVGGWLALNGLGDDADRITMTDGARTTTTSEVDSPDDTSEDGSDDSSDGAGSTTSRVEASTTTTSTREPEDAATAIEPADAATTTTTEALVVWSSPFPEPIPTAPAPAPTTTTTTEPPTTRSTTTTTTQPTTDTTQPDDTTTTTREKPGGPPGRG